MIVHSHVSSCSPPPFNQFFSSHNSISASYLSFLLKNSISVSTIIPSFVVGLAFLSSICLTTSLMDFFRCLSSHLSGLLSHCFPCVHILAIHKPQETCFFSVARLVDFYTPDAKVSNIPRTSVRVFRLFFSTLFYPILKGEGLIRKMLQFTHFFLRGGTRKNLHYRLTFSEFYFITESQHSSIRISLSTTVDFRLSGKLYYPASEIFALLSNLSIILPR